MSFQQRICRKTSGSKKVNLSVQIPVSCCNNFKYCEGNYVSNLFTYLINKGTVPETCVPYVAGSGRTLSCPSSCTGSGSWTVYKATRQSRPNGASAMKNALYSNGPIAVCFTVYSDFMSYKSGIYKHVSGSRQGGHAIVLLGYGVENGVNYWICQNSWGPRWGEQGYFRIKMGQCAIDSATYGGEPIL